MSLASKGHRSSWSFFSNTGILSQYFVCNSLVEKMSFSSNLTKSSVKVFSRLFASSQRGQSLPLTRIRWLKQPHLDLLNVECVLNQYPSRLKFHWYALLPKQEMILPQQRF